MKPLYYILCEMNDFYQYIYINILQNNISSNLIDFKPYYFTWWSPINTIEFYVLKISLLLISAR